MHTLPMSPADQLRYLGQCIVTGAQGLKPIVNDFFSFDDGCITGCCAMGGALLAIKPEIRAMTHSEITLGNKLDDDQEVLAMLFEKFPVLTSKELTKSFIDTIGAPESIFDLFDGGVDQCQLLHVITTTFDQDNKTVGDVQSALNALADKLDAQSASVH